MQSASMLFYRLYKANDKFLICFVAIPKKKTTDALKHKKSSKSVRRAAAYNI